MLQELVKDEHYEVKMGVLSELQIVATVVGPDLVTSTLLMSLATLIKEQKWRVRMAVIQLTANLAKEFGKDFYAKNLEPIFLQFLTDNAASVRDMGNEKVQMLANEFKVDWVVNSYIPKANEIMSKEKQGYLYRMAVLNSINVFVVAQFCRVLLSS